jgi:cytochrome c oxidase subunit 2
MARTTTTTTSGPSWFPIQAEDRPHAIRLVIIWVIVSIIGIIGVLQIHYPPYDNSIQGTDQSKTLALLTALATPVFVGVVLMVLYSAIFFRRTTADLVDGHPMFGNSTTQIVWIGVSSILVLFMAFIGITTLASDNVAQFLGVPGRGLSGGESNATGGVAVDKNKELEVQVIGQEWYFTYRYPSYGGVETTHLYLPVNVPIDLHVTSLDVIHSFWAYQLGVKADANQGIDNEFHVTPTKITSFQIRCAELCGLWHGNMYDTGQVVSQSDFQSWIQQQQSQNSESQKALPSYAPVYFPAPTVKGS